MLVRPICHFFNKYPALYYAFHALMAMEASLQKMPFLLLANLLFSAIILPHAFRAFLGFCVGIGSFAMVHTTLTFSQLPKEGIEGFAWITIDQVSYQKGRHSPVWTYRGRIKSFTEPSGSISMQGIPFFFALQEKKEPRPSADSEYMLHCTLKPGQGKRVILKPTPKVPWELIPKSFSLTESRFAAKRQVKNWIERNFTSPQVMTFLSGLIIGEFDDTGLKNDFGRFGLLHILAISGFHFSIFAKLLSSLFKPFLAPKKLAITIMGLLSFYFLFLGWGPSVLRAWMTLILLYGSSMNHRSSLSINSLGFALLFSSILDPLLLENLGFQFSFLTTAAILMGYEPTLKIVQRIFPERPLEIVSSWPVLDQLSYLALGMTKNSFALGLTTSCTALPLSLYYFQAFPLLTLLYNLFFPFLVSISMGLLLLGFLLSPFPYFPRAIHALNDYFTAFILNLTYDIPTHWDWVIFTPQFSPLWIVGLNILLFLIIVYCCKSKNELEYLHP